MAGAYIPSGTDLSPASQQMDMELEGGVNPPLLPATVDPQPIDRLGPQTELHKMVLKKLLDRLNMSERKMNSFYSRWRWNEKRMQAFIDLPQYEQLLKQVSQTKDNTPPPLVSITVPYTFSTIWTIVTYLAQTFTGKKPMFQVGSLQAELVEAASLMETKLQYDADHTRLIRALFQFFLDGEMYGVGVIRTLWETKKAFRTSWSMQPVGGQLIPDTAPTNVRQRTLRTVYEGNNCVSVDPFMFFPDPRVPMAEVNRKGEFVFWRTYLGKHIMKKAEKLGELKWIDAAGNTLPNNFSDSSQSIRNLISSGDASAGSRDTQDRGVETYFQVDQGTVEIVPAEWGLSESQEIEKWIFTILNKKQIVQAEPLELDHDMHPVAVIEPYTFGYGFGQVGSADMLGPLQDTISWFINSHIHNVRSTMNNSFIVNPSAVEMQDLKGNQPGKLIRLKPSAYGVDVRTVIQQLQVSDVTQGHVRDMQEFIRMGDQLSAVNDNLRGINQAGGRKTATEVRTSGEAGASRLATHARLISAQGIVDLTEQMSLNNQQNLTQEFYLQVVGQDGLSKPSIIHPQDLVGDFFFPVHDGTLPIDRVGALDIWKEILTGVAQDPQLRASYDIGRIFEFVAQLGGAQNITSFRLMQPQQMQQQQEAGNLVPLPNQSGGAMPPGMEALGGLSG